MNRGPQKRVTAARKARQARALAWVNAVNVERLKHGLKPLTWWRLTELQKFSIMGAFNNRLKRGQPRL